MAKIFDVFESHYCINLHICMFNDDVCFFSILIIKLCRLEMHFKNDLVFFVELVKKLCKTFILLMYI